MNYSWQTKSNFPVWLGKRISKTSYPFFRAHLFLCDLIVPLYFQLLGFQNILHQKDTTTSVIILVTFCKSFRITQSKMSPIFFVLTYCWWVLILKIVCVKGMYVVWMNLLHNFSFLIVFQQRRLDYSDNDRTMIIFSIRKANRSHNLTMHFWKKITNKYKL